MMAPGQPRGPMRGKVPGQKAQAFGPTMRRLAGQLKPEKWMLSIVAVLAIAGVALAVIGPKILGAGTNLIFEGFISSRLPQGATKDQVIEGLRSHPITIRCDRV